MGAKSSGGERVAYAVATGGLSELNRPILQAGQNAVDKFNAPAEEARKAAEEQARLMREMSDKAASEKAAADKTLQDQLKQEAEGTAMKSAKQRQARLAMGAQGRRDTILTGPLGLTASGPKSGKTLLGA